MGVGVAAVSGVGVLAGYFAHALPGKHASGSAVTTSGTSSGSTGNTGAGGSGNSGGTVSSGNTGSVGSSGGSSNSLSTPAVTPRHSRSTPQVVSGSS